MARLTVECHKFLNPLFLFLFFFNVLTMSLRARLTCTQFSVNFHQTTSYSLQSFHFNIPRNKMWPIDRNRHAFPDAGLPTLPSSFHCFKYSFSLLFGQPCATFSTKTEERPRIFKLPEGGLFNTPGNTVIPRITTRGTYFKFKVTSHLRGSLSRSSEKKFVRALVSIKAWQTIHQNKA